MDISVYFEGLNPLDEHLFQPSERVRLGDKVEKNLEGKSFPDYSNADIVIIGVGESRNAINNYSSQYAPDQVRKKLYQLYPPTVNSNIVDLGNIRIGNEVKDTYFALHAVLAELMEQNIIPLIIGGSQDLTYANYLAYVELGKIINIAVVDPKFDLGNNEEQIDSQSYLSKIILHQPNFLFNYTNIGYQSYFVDPDAIKLIDKLYFDAYRLGVVRSDISSMEPLVRNADMLSFDISAIRHSDAPGNENATPNGFYGEEACQLCRYAGMSDKLSSFGIYEINPERDNHEQTAFLAAEMIWYFIEGYYSRKKDQPTRKLDDYVKYTVSIEDDQYELTFLKSKKTDRWWMRVPVNEEAFEKYERHYLVPCAYEDYQMACANEVPDRWWKVYQKLM